MIVQEDIFSALARSNNLDDLDPKTVTSDAVRASYAHADYAWKVEALSKLRTLCESQRTFTVEDLQKTVAIVIEDNSAYGGLMTIAKEKEWIRGAGHERSKDPAKHGRLIVKWESLLYHL